MKTCLTVIAGFILTAVGAVLVGSISSAYILLFKIAEEEDSQGFLVAAWIWLVLSIVLHICVFFGAAMDRSIAKNPFSFAVGAFIVNNLIGWAVYSYVYSSFIK